MKQTIRCVNKIKKLDELITSIEEDLDTLLTDECYQKHVPEYYAEHEYYNKFCKSLNFLKDYKIDVGNITLGYDDYLTGIFGYEYFNSDKSIGEIINNFILPELKQLLLKYKEVSCDETNN